MDGLSAGSTKRSFCERTRIQPLPSMRQANSFFEATSRTTSPTATTWLTWRSLPMCGDVSFGARRISTPRTSEASHRTRDAATEGMHGVPPSVVVSRETHQHFLAVQALEAVAHLAHEDVSKALGELDKGHLGAGRRDLLDGLYPLPVSTPNSATSCGPLHTLTTVPAGCTSSKRLASRRGSLANDMPLGYTIWYMSVAASSRGPSTGSTATKSPIRMTSQPPVVTATMSSSADTWRMLLAAKTSPVWSTSPVSAASRDGPSRSFTPPSYTMAK
eukprot:scaffold7998_cov258-Pinguiococcus_pyrenoidosus.AAC.3